MDTIKQTEQWFKDAGLQQNQDTLNVQLGCFMEEVAEVLEQVKFHDDGYRICLSLAKHHLERLGRLLKLGAGSFDIGDRVELLDGLCYTIVTAVGMGHIAKMDVPGALDEVNRSNFSKFKDGKHVFQKGGKIGKGKDYTEPDSKKFV